MAGIMTTEGETLMAEVVHQRIHIDRDADLLLGLFTNVGADDSLTEATVTEPSGTGYARITLTDATWNVTADTADYAQQTFTGGAGGWTGDVYGYFVASQGTTARLLYLEIDSGGSYTINENDTYKITLNITISG
jgi:hypothetical protein